MNFDGIFTLRLDDVNKYDSAYQNEKIKTEYASPQDEDHKRLLSPILKSQMNPQTSVRMQSRNIPKIYQKNDALNKMF
jgi:hypothetical protein